MRCAPAIKNLAADSGPLQLSLFVEQDLAEITQPGLPGERLIACRDPAPVASRSCTSKVGTLTPGSSRH